MPARNRVTPLGEIVAIPLRGAWTGNRGILHRGREVVRFHASDLWITCALEFRDRRQEQWRPGHYTLLFFHDEAVSLAAGHRPCAFCRRPAYEDYRAAWAAGLGGPIPSAGEVNRRLHGERIRRGTHQRRLHEHSWGSLPDAAFVLHEGRPHLVLGGHLVAWGRAGYGEHRRRPARGDAVTITPPSSIAALRAGYEPQVDRSARKPSRSSRR